ncbi:23539_t:CDS:2 [Dentiscutata erythropus]|uniref:23539_t:CDS:1 n=1 Tax=Dentiscutata erythropus TaxID=1348616 RepID=A0A9N8YVI5_9GLOM|nr:23539_t:CDS:2 [Dentiscutata erythropus]
MSKVTKFMKEDLKTIIDGTLLIAKCIPATQTAALLVEQIREAIKKAKHGQAICMFIAKNVEDTQKILEQCENIQVNDVVLKQYLEVLNKIKEYIHSIQHKNSFNIWKKIKHISTAAEYENKCLLLIEELNSIGDKFRLTLQLDTKKDTTEIKENLAQFRKDLHLIAMYHGLASPNSINIRPSDIRDVPTPLKVKKGNVEKKAFITYTQLVAQKCLGSLSCYRENEQKEKERMINMLQLLSDCENVVKFYGILEAQSQLYMIISWCEHGNLEEYMKKNPDLDWSIKLKIAIGIANGLVFCHHRDILHHDVRSHNILLDANICAKLSGFHLSRKDGHETTTIDQIETRWIAPEKLLDKNVPYTKECDIYSFAIVLWEISMQRMPYDELDDLKDPEALVEYANSGNRPQIIDESVIPRSYAKIMKEAWKTEPYKRPSAEIMHRKLATCLEDDYLDLSLNSELQSSFLVVPPVPLQYENSPPPETQLEHYNYKDAINYHKKKQYQNALPIFQRLASEEYMRRAAKHRYTKAAIKFVELQVSEISWLVARKPNKSELLEYLRNEESLIENCEIGTKNELEKKISKLRKIIQSSTGQQNLD